MCDEIICDKNKMKKEKKWNSLFFYFFMKA